MGIVMSSIGYPESYETGKEISGLNNLLIKMILKSFIPVHTLIKNNNILTNGGRVLCVTALGDDLNQSNDNAYSAVELIDWDGKYYRKILALE